MSAEDTHQARVSVWLERLGTRVPPERLLHAFSNAFDTLWRRAHRTLGDVTLMAIADRVLYSASEQFPLLATLRIEPTGLNCEDLKAQAPRLESEPLQAAIRFVLVEFLTVLGVLTAEILTPALHTELARLIPEKPSRPSEAERGARSPTPSRDEESHG